MTQLPASAYAEHGGVLDPEFHRPLIDDVERLAASANIPVPAVWSRMSESCTPAEVAYLTAIRRRAAEGRYGLVYTGARPAHPPTNRMMAFAGACLRNYISARLATLDEVLSALKAGEGFPQQVLLVPNFYVGPGGRIGEWQVSGLLSLLIGRQVASQQTLLYVHSLSELGERYGASFVAHLRANFEVLVEQ